MAVEVNDRDRSVRLVDTSQQGKGDSVVTAESDDTRESLSSLGEALLVRICERLAHQDAVVTLLNLLDSPGIVISMYLSVKSYII